MLEQTDNTRVINIDRMTYAAADGTRFHGWPEEPPPSASKPKILHLGSRHLFVRGDVANSLHVKFVFDNFRPDCVVHFAAESHVDRAIEGSRQFVVSNVSGTQVLLDHCEERGIGRFVYVSTDEVYGPVAEPDVCSEIDRLDPRNPYAATKAAAEYLCMSHYNTYATPVVITRGCNTFGPWQYPEKLLPLMILNALEGKPLPVYGDGNQVREWIHVDDHCDAIMYLIENGTLGETYNIGSGERRFNIEVVRKIVKLTGASDDQIQHVKDRPGHDNRYAVSSDKLYRLGWDAKQPLSLFDDGLSDLIDWYKSEEGQAWCARLRGDARDRRGLPDTTEKQG
jgi:dTDP-glucose 4,6-dehydratase